MRLGALLAGLVLAVGAAPGAAWAGPAPRAEPALLDFTADERAQILSHGPWPPPPAPDGANRAQGRPAAIAWGRELFSDKRLSRSGQLACASCHVPGRAFQDGLPTAQAGAAAASRRNTPTVQDTDLQRWLGWDGAHDSLWAASLAPLLARDEMGQGVADLAGQVRRTPALRSGYRRAFGAPPPTDDERLVVDLAKALAAYKATLRSPRTPFDDFRDALAHGDLRAASRYPLAAQRGLRLFIGHGRCSVCHAGPVFSNGEFADIGVPFFVPGGVDPGRHGGLQALQASRMNRLGPHNDAGEADPRAVTTRHVLIEPRHFGEFRVPGLRQLAHTAPYMHNGSLATVEDVVRHYDQLNEDRLHADGERILRRLDLSAQQAADLAVFLRSLSR
jgi:cytochrome c peroxidase